MPDREGAVVVDGERMIDHNRGSEVVRTRCVFPATCTIHGGTPGFTNLAVSRHRGGIMIDPHVTGSCVLTLDGNGATALRDMLTAWFT
ncbi:MAG: hypothetical protein JO268_18310 [Pseudonocardiales bacterium]|nr:hypothetical protein [Pseudonocardiales bacterium]